jgi:hypothetical protein
VSADVNPATTANDTNHRAIHFCMTSSVALQITASPMARPNASQPSATAELVLRASVARVTGWCHNRHFFIGDLTMANEHRSAVASSTSRPANKLLSLLESKAFDRVAPKLKPVSLASRQVLYRPNESIHAIYFPESAVIVQLSVMINGDTIETATVGREGASWISASIGAPSMPCETLVAIGGHAHTLDIDDLDREMQENEHFRICSHSIPMHSSFTA